MGIKFTEKKPEFDLKQWEDHFKRIGCEVPKNEKEFLDDLEIKTKGKSFPIRLLTEAIAKKLNWEISDVEDEYSEKKDKINAFLEQYNVIYNSSETKAAPVNAETFASCIVEEDTEPMTLEEAQDFLDEHHSKQQRDVSMQIKVDSPKLYENMPITVNSRFRIKCSVENISRNCVMLLNDDLDEVAAVGRIVNKEGSDFILVERDNINYNAFRGKTNFHLAVFKLNECAELTGEFLCHQLQIEMHELEFTEHVLCIDFGTSNTTAGSYRIKNEFGSEPELVEFADVTQENRLVNYFPTIVYVVDCSNKENIEYKFGFEAKKLEKRKNYESTASVFYQIKHWLLEDSCDPEEVSLFDENGSKISVPKRDVVHAYLKHIIALSENYFGVRFRKLHFTAPVKMKCRFISILKEILPEYEIVEDGIDEAGAILFDYVQDQFQKWCQSKEKEGSGNVAVIDCGGGTTDLATCHYQFCPSDDASKISRIVMKTQFSNGDFNFGGNNITYRIMQLIKLKIALKYHYITSEEFDEVMEHSENDILRDADAFDYNTDDLSRAFDELYNRCENFLPTQFENLSDDLFDDDRPKVKRNFYYLWQFAEQVKFTFYRKEKEVKKDNWDEVLQEIGDQELNYLYQKKGDSLEKLPKPLDNLEITITEIRKVIFGDIYSLLNRILNLENGLPNPVYDYYRLSGQSCKINLFNELLKEFIPGKRLRAKMERNIEHLESISLKKHCIEGSIRFMMNKRLKMTADIENQSIQAERIYTVEFEDLNDEYSTKDSEHALVFFPIKEGLEEVTMNVKNNGKIVRRIKLPTKSVPGIQKANIEELIAGIQKNTTSVDWETTRKKLADYQINGENGNVRFVTAIPAGNEDGYGFNVHFIRKVIENGEQSYSFSYGKYYNYEAAASGFFDGKR